MHSKTSQGVSGPWSTLFTGNLMSDDSLDGQHTPPDKRRDGSHVPEVFCWVYYIIVLVVS